MVRHDKTSQKEKCVHCQKQRTQKKGDSDSCIPHHFYTSRFRQAYCMCSTYLTYPHKGGFTVTDSPGLSPDSVSCAKQVRTYIYIFKYHDKKAD